MQCGFLSVSFLDQELFINNRLRVFLKEKERRGAVRRMDPAIFGLGSKQNYYPRVDLLPIPLAPSPEGSSPVLPVTNSLYTIANRMYSSSVMDGLVLLSDFSKCALVMAAVSVATAADDDDDFLSDFCADDPNTPFLIMANYIPHVVSNTWFMSLF